MGPGTMATAVSQQQPSGVRQTVPAVSPQPVVAHQTVPAAAVSTAQQQSTVMRQTVPAVVSQQQPAAVRQAFPAVSQQPAAVRQTVPAISQPAAVSTPPPSIRLPTQPVAISKPAVTSTVTSQLTSPAASPVSTPAASVNSPAMGQQMTPDTAKVKCRNFLATLLRLASDQPENVAKNVRELIQGLIESRIEPEVFTTKLQKELNSSPQPCLVPFLKKSLPYLQHSLATKELTIEGVIPPAMSQVGKLGSPTNNSARPGLPSGMGGPTVMRPATVTRPTFVRPSLPTRPVQLSSSLSTSSSSLMPPPKVPGLVTKRPGDDDNAGVSTDDNKKFGTDNAGSIFRPNRDTAFLQNGLLHQKVSRICKEKGLESPPQEVLNMISEATQQRLKTLVSKLSVIAEHRLDIIRSEGNYEVSQDIKQQLRFLEELDKMEKKRHEEAERELLLRAAKSRTKTDDPEREKLKAKAKDMQRDEAERIRHEEANRTALEAIGGPKKRKFGDIDSLMGPPPIPVRSRTKRVHLRDVMFMMEQEKSLKHSDLLFRCYFS